MWFLNNDKNILTNGNVYIYYTSWCASFYTHKYGICIEKGYSENGKIIGYYESIEDVKQAFNELVKKVNLYENVVEIG